MNEFEKMAELLLSDVINDPSYYEEMYPSRNLPENARVTRIAPSPTGYLHLGVLFMALVNRLTATSTGGVFYTRIEDTDKKREVEGGIDDIINGLNRFGITIDEGFINGDAQVGAYGPYQQSHREEIYKSYAKSLVKQGLAYPCFCTAAELMAVRGVQETDKIRTGYHGKWAKHRDITVDQASHHIAEGLSFVIRLKSPGNEKNRVFFDDGIKGKIEMPENDEDFVILKSDGIPTYHFAHAIDDYLMRTTHVIRGDEWISSTPKHLQLFKLLGVKPPKYAHVAPIMKSDNGAKRKISKRRDPEAAMHFFAEQGFDSTSVIEYLMTILSSDYEQWHNANQQSVYCDYKFTLRKMSVSGALFDWDKLCDVAKNTVSKMDSKTVLTKVISWSQEFDLEFYTVLNNNINYASNIFAIDRDVPKPRKDIYKWDMVKNYYSYFFDEYYTPCYDLPDNLKPCNAAAVLDLYCTIYDETAPREQWFESIKLICPPLGFAAETKDYKANPDLYKGHAGDASTIIRIAITSRRNTPDLCSIMQVLGKDKCIARMSDAAKFYRSLGE